MQFTQRRLADLAIDLLGCAATISRTTRLIGEKGEKDCQHEIDLTQAFCGHAGHRMKRNVRAFDDNDDDLLKGIADWTYSLGGYPYDALT